MESLLVQKKLQDDSEYINVETPVFLSEEGNYINTNPVARESTGDSYVNFIYIHPNKTVFYIVY